MFSADLYPHSLSVRQYDTKYEEYLAEIGLAQKSIAYDKRLMMIKWQQI